LNQIYKGKSAQLDYLGSLMNRFDDNE
jgi:hypothetical protein